MQAPNPIAISLFGVSIRWYGIIIGLSILVAIAISYKRAPKFNINPEHFLDFSIWVIPIAIVGARLYYVIFEWETYNSDILAMFNIRRGGLAIHGGLIAGIIVGLIICKIKKINFFDLADLLFPQIALAQAIGRWGNFFNAEAHGGPTDLPWGIIIRGQKVHPTFLYESLWCFALFIFLIYISNNRKFKGQILLLYSMLYSLERFFVEELRTDSLMIGEIKQAQLLSASVFIIALIAYFYLSRRSYKQQIK